MSKRQGISKNIHERSSVMTRTKADFSIAGHGRGITSNSFNSIPNKLHKLSTALRMPGSTLRTIRSSENDHTGIPMRRAPTRLRSGWARVTEGPRASITHYRSSIDPCAVQKAMASLLVPSRVMNSSTLESTILPVTLVSSRTRERLLGTLLQQNRVRTHQIQHGGRDGCVCRAEGASEPFEMVQMARR